LIHVFQWSCGLLDQKRQSQYRATLDFAQQQVEALIERHPDFFPIYTEGGCWAHQGELWTDWTGGFLVGMMWRFCRHGDANFWQPRAEHYSRLLEPRQHDRNVHDLGFIFLNSYLPWYERTGEARLNEVLIQAGRTLSMRFQPRGEYLCSFIGPESLFIDIMMNVPILFYAAAEAGDEQVLEKALAHCRTTARYLVREDGSTAHEGWFDPETGRFLRQSTHQGLAAESCWARGLAWSLYGFGTVYRYCRQPEFLKVAERNAAYWLGHLPDDGVPYWDFDADLSAPLPWGPQKDSSAGAIAASGLWQLSELTDSSRMAQRYRATAIKMLDSMQTPEYLARETPGWQGILKHGVYHTKKGLGVDESVMWGEYFFVEALDRALSANSGPDVP